MSFYVMIEYPSITKLPLDKSRVDWLRYCDWGHFTPILYVSTTGGMCNRILGLASCMAKAALEKRVISVYWPLNGSDGTDVKWEDLFLDKLHFFTEWDLYWIMDIMHEVKWYDGVSSAYAGVDQSNIVVVKSSYDFFSDGHSLLDHSLAISWLKSLRVQPDILNKVESFGLPKNTLGVHLRVAEAHIRDGLFDEDPITPAIYERIRAWSGPVLAVSNNKQSKLKLQSMFPGKIISQDNIKHDRTSEGTQSAMVDLLLLSKCSERIGNNSSTFFKLANYWA